MKLCFVILAHHQPILFHRLVETLSIGGSDVVVHVDRRTDISTFSGPRHANIHYMTNRRTVHWSGWSLTRTIVDAMQCALRVSDADYFLLLAGTDFPIRPVKSLIDFLRERHPANFLSYYPLVPGIWGYQLIRRFVFNDLKGVLTGIRNPAALGLFRARRLLCRLVEKVEGALYVFLPARNTSWIRFYSGSARWCLNRDTARYVVEYFHSRESQRLRTFLRFCANSDEILIQTAVLNSVHRNQCTGYCEVEAREIFEGRRPPLPDEKKLNLHFVDWNPDREDPAILVEADFPHLKGSAKFFAYKFTDDRSMELVNRIERELLKAESVLPEANRVG